MHELGAALHDLAVSMHELKPMLRDSVVSVHDLKPRSYFEHKK